MAIFPFKRIALLAAALLFTAPALASEPRNHLADQSSPYLQLHKGDPVNWRIWGEAALAEAKKSGKPIFISIGYTACHWCHVMQKESFTDPDTAKLINKLFLPILVDREERPDIDGIFQSAAALMGLPNGWPLNMFLTPGGKPFFGGAYFPKEARGGMPAFKAVLTQVDEVYAKDPKGIAKNAAAVASALDDLSKPQPGVVSLKDIDAAANFFQTLIDPLSGGFADPPKFPQTVALETLWRSALRNGDKEQREAVLSALRAMVQGGLFDHVGGGFYRYAVDDLWRVPHFEKMLDVNAALLSLLTEAWRETKAPLFKLRAEQTVSFLLSEMRLPGGAFAASLDADSLNEKGIEEEGAYYTWSRNELESLLGDKDSPFFKAFSIAATEGENLDGPEDAGTLFRLEEAPLDPRAEKALEERLRTLKKRRDARHRPRRDTKVLADWNALAISALTEAGLAFGRDDWLAAAEKAFAFVAKNLTGPDGALRHSWHASGRAGALGARANLADLAYLSQTALTLFEATGNPAYLARSKGWVKYALDRFWDIDQGGFFATDAKDKSLMVRVKPIVDNPNPSGNGAMIEVLARLYFLTGEDDLSDKAYGTLTLFGALAKDPSPGTAAILNAAETLLIATQVVIVGKREEKGTADLLREIVTTSLPNRILEVIAPGTVLPENHPARYKKQVDGLATAYVCKGTVCSLPATSRTELAQTLAAMR